MSLIACRECGKEISRQAKACPHCGAPSAAAKAQEAGSKMMACGCVLTLLVTIPLLIFIFAAL